MAVIDELIVRKGTTRYPIDSYDNTMIDEIVVAGQSFHFAKQKDLTGTSEIVADNGVAEPIISLNIVGNTVQDGTPTPDTPIPIENANNNGMTVTVHGKNLIDIGTQETVAEYWGKRASALTITSTGISAKVLEYKAMWSNYIKRRFNTGTYTVSCKSDYDWRFLVFPYDTDGNRITTKPSGVGMSAFSWVSGSGYDCWVSNRPASSSRLTFTVPDSVDSFGIGFGWIDQYATNSPTGAGVGTTYEISEMQLEVGNITNPVYEPYYGEQITIPTSVTVDGKNVPLLFSEYDKLTVDRVNNKVIYTEGSWYRKLTGKEADWSRNAWAYNNGYGTYYLLWLGHLNVNATAKVGRCSHFKYTTYQHPAIYNSLAFESSLNLQICTDRETPLADFKLWLQQKYAEGDPVTVLVKRATSDIREHDITNTDLGQSLLALATRKGTNYLEISSDLAPSQTDLSYWRQIIPNE